MTLFQENFDPVITKIEESRHNLDRLSHIKSSKDFFPAVNAFLTSARSIVSVLAYQFGFHELGLSPKGKTLRSQLSAADKLRRQNFDAWLEKKAKPILDHPLKEERDEGVHRTGQAGFHFYPKPGPGIAFSAGGPFKTARVFYGKGRIGLPIRDNNIFLYRSPDGSERDAYEYCKQFLDEIEVLINKARSKPWV